MTEQKPIKIKKPEDILNHTGCPVCKEELTQKAGGGICYCKQCDIEYYFVPED